MNLEKLTINELKQFAKDNGVHLKSKLQRNILMELLAFPQINEVIKKAEIREKIRKSKIKYNKLQLELLEKGVIKNKTKKISWPTGAGKSLGVLLYLDILENKKTNFIFTTGQPLTLSWGKELKKWKGNNFNISTTKLTDAYCCQTKLGQLMRSSKDNHAARYWVRTIDFLGNNLDMFRQELPNIVFDEYDTYPEAAKKLIEYIEKMYSKVGVAERILKVSATGDDSKTPIIEFDKTIELPAYNKSKEAVVNTQHNCIFFPEKNIYVVEMKTHRQLYDWGVVGKYIWRNLTVLPKGCNFFFETYMHLNGSNDHSEVHKLIDVIDFQQSFIPETIGFNDYKKIEAIDDDSNFVDAVVNCITTDYVENHIIQNNFGAGVDMNMKNVYIDYEQMEFLQGENQAIKNFIQRLGRVNRTLSSQETPGMVFVRGFSKVSEHLKKFILNVSTQDIKEKHRMNPIHSIINREFYKIRPYALKFKVVQKTETKTKSLSATYWTYNRSIKEKFDDEVYCNDEYPVIKINSECLTGIREKMEEIIKDNFDFANKRLQRKLEKLKRRGIERI